MVSLQDINAEKAFLSSVLQDYKIMENDSIFVNLRSDDFSLPIHKLIYQAIINEYETIKIFDAITISNRIDNDDTFLKVGGAKYLVDLIETFPINYNIGSYVDIIVSKSKIRALDEYTKSVHKILSDDLSADEMILMAEQNISRLSKSRTSNDIGVVDVKNSMGLGIDKLSDLKALEGDYPGVSTGFSKLDKQIGGFQKGHLVILAGRPGMGKTTFGLNLAENISFHSDKPFLIFSMEMPAEELAMKLLAGFSHVSQAKLLEPKSLSDNDIDKLINAMDDFPNNKIMISDHASLSPNVLRSIARKVNIQYGGISGIMIDYLQLMKSPGIDNRTQEVSEISRSLKSLALELKVPILALSQLNRNVENREGNRPMMADLRESGAIEQDADVIMFVHREDKFKQANNSKPNSKAEIIIGKNRHGTTDSVYLYFNGSMSKFTAMVSNEYENHIPPEADGDIVF